MKFFETFQKISQENGEKWIILADFSQNLTNHGLLFARLDEKHNLLEILRKFSKNFLKKIAKNALF